MDIFTTQIELKIKDLCRKGSELILKEKLRLYQFAEIVVPFTNAKTASLWTENKHWQITCSNFGGRLATNIPKARNFNL